MENRASPNCSEARIMSNSHKTLLNYARTWSNNGKNWEFCSFMLTELCSRSLALETEEADVESDRKKNDSKLNPATDDEMKLRPKGKPVR